MHKSMYNFTINVYSRRVSEKKGVISGKYYSSLQKAPRAYARRARAYCARLKKRQKMSSIKKTEAKIFLCAKPFFFNEVN